MGLNRGRKSDKVPAHQTYRKSLGAPQLTPPKFRRQLKTTVLTEAVAADYQFPTGLDGDLVFVDLRQDLSDTAAATLVTIEEQLLATDTLRSYRKTKDAQLETLNESLVDEDATPPAFNALTSTFSQEALGDGKSVRTIGTIPDVFGADEYRRERPLVWPMEFRALVDEVGFGHTSAGQAAAPDPLDIGDTYISDTQLDEFTHRLESRGYDLGTLPLHLLSLKTNRYKQVEYLLRTLEADTTTPATPTAVLDVEFTPLGDGSAIELWDYTADLFLQNTYSRSRGVVTPEDFRAKLQIREHSELVIGTSSDPTLGAGDIDADESQENEFVYRNKRRSIDTASLPQQIVNTRTNRYKQVETVTRILEADSTTPAVPTALRDVDFQKLGDDTALEVRVDIPAVFEGLSSSTEILDMLPEVFKASLPSHVREFSQAGTVSDPPGLDPGDLERVESQSDAFTKRVRTRGRSGISYPQEKIVRRGVGASEFGGEILKLTGYLNTSEPPVETGFDVTKSEVTTLGDGTYFRQTERLDTASVWPILTEYDQDPETQALITTTYQVVDAATVSTPSIISGQITRYKKIDQWRSLMIIETYSLPADYEEQRFMAHTFPSLWDWHTYVYNTPCGAVGPIRHGFSSMVQARLAISFSTSKQTITGLTLIPNTHHLVHDIVAGVLNDVGVINYFGDCTGPVSLPASSPDYTTYNSTIRGTEQLISGESVLWKAGLYKNSRLYVTML